MSLESRVKFNHEIAEKETARSSYRAGQHFFVVTAATKRESKEKDDFQGIQYKMLELTVKPLTDPNDITTVVGRGMRIFQCLPFWDETWDDLDYEVRTKEGLMHVKKYLERNMIIFAGSIRNLFAAVLPSEVPAEPFKVNEETISFMGEEREIGDYKECNTTSKAASGEVAERLWNEGPDELVGKGFYGLVTYAAGESDASQWPELKRFGSEQLIDRKTKEQIPLVPEDQIMQSNETDEENEAEEKSAASKSNGAKGKPQASTKTVAAAAKSKGKPSGRQNARR